MTRHACACALELTAKEWELILMALRAYQHHALYRELQEKIAPLGGAQDVSLLVAGAGPVSGHPASRRVAWTR